MDEMTLRNSVKNMPFSFPLVEGNAINIKATDPKLNLKCCYLTVFKKSDTVTIEVFIKPDTYFIVTSATYNFSSFEMNVSRTILNDHVHYDQLKDYVGEENMNMVDDRILYYVFKSLR